MDDHIQTRKLTAEINSKEFKDGQKNDHRRCQLAVKTPLTCINVKLTLWHPLLP